MGDDRDPLLCPAGDYYELDEALGALAHLLGGGSPLRDGWLLVDPVVAHRLFDRISAAADDVLTALEVARANR